MPKPPLSAWMRALLTPAPALTPAPRGSTPMWGLQLGPQNRHERR